MAGLRSGAGVPNRARLCDGSDRAGRLPREAPPSRPDARGVRPDARRQRCPNHGFRPPAQSQRAPLGGVGALLVGRGLRPTAPTRCGGASSDGFADARPGSRRHAKGRSPSAPGSRARPERRLHSTGCAVPDAAPGKKVRFASRCRRPLGPVAEGGRTALEPRPSKRLHFRRECATSRLRLGFVPSTTDPGVSSRALVPRRGARHRASPCRPREPRRAEKAREADARP